MHYMDVVQTVSKAYWEALLKNDEQARQVARDTIETMGFDPKAADVLLKDMIQPPVTDWLSQGSAAS